MEAVAALVHVREVEGSVVYSDSALADAPLIGFLSVAMCHRPLGRPEQGSMPLQIRFMGSVAAIVGDEGRRGRVLRDAAGATQAGAGVKA